VVRRKSSFENNILDNGSTKESETSQDHREKFAEIFTRKYGSLQKFIDKADIAGNFSSDLFDVDQVHKIGILDLRVLNCDRNDENILVLRKKKKNSEKSYFKLIPIDHSLSLPDCIEIQEYEMCWMSWNQAKKPFSKKSLEYIESINIMEDIRCLNELVKIRDISLKNFRISNILLKKCARNGLTLYDIGKILYRPELEETPSKLESIVEKSNNICELLYNSNINEKLLTSKIEYFELLKKSNTPSNTLSKQRTFSFNNVIKENASPTKMLLNELTNNGFNINLIDFEDSDSCNDTNDDNRLKIDNEDKINEMIAVNKTNSCNTISKLDIKNEKKHEKKSNSLKRTLSVPKLNKINDNENEEEEEKQSDEQKLTKKFHEFKKKDSISSSESALNKVFFYYFEQFLDDFLKKEYKISKIK